MVAIQSYYPDLNADLAVDAVQEFKVQSGYMPAEYGLTAGGVINVATKSGTNAYHGTAYEFVRNDVFDARNAFTTSTPPFRYNQYGIAFGGPVIIPKVYNGRDKTFIFGNWEQWNYVKNSQTITTVPTLLERNGDFSRSFSAPERVIPIYDPGDDASQPQRKWFYSRRVSRQSDSRQSSRPCFAEHQRVLSAAQSDAVESIHECEQLHRPCGQCAKSCSNTRSALDHHFSEADTFFARYTYFRHHDDNGASAPWPSPVVRVRE